MQGPMNFLKSQDGSVAVYAALFTAVAVGAGALALDYGRLSLLRSEMQNSADAAALSAARFLDGSDGAQNRARDVATNSLTSFSSVSNENLTVKSVNFYASLNPDVPATTDKEAKFIQVRLDGSAANLMFAPVVSMITGKGTTQSQELVAEATAGPNPFLCHAPPLMICDFLENSPPIDLRSSDNFGRMVVLKEPQGGGNWAPGNFGLLSLPDGSSGANPIEAALAAVTPEECYNITIETAQGSKTNKIVDAINSRFDLPGNPWPYPAPNVINYPRDDVIVADENLKLGDGKWDINTYWNEKHSGSLPADLQPHNGKQATRLQVYLYELGEPFWRNGNITIYPIPTSDSLPSGYKEVKNTTSKVPRDLSNKHDNNYDGEPSDTVAANGAARRFVQVAQLQCIADNIHGNGHYPNSGNYIEVFLTEFVPDPPNAAIYGEIVRGLTPSNSAEYHANVKLY
ncbi:pilus assembly protein TadG-related protein [Sneathiella limimaris]|uniref:pilus assembly protein TadG-related protein n=1 Tax=Sneathiella limimaris TaxID=1964213 RepID=UPI00146CD915|nr:pilus assembly protein TadG-related protein [Sneathiella limimaris]